VGKWKLAGQNQLMDSTMGVTQFSETLYAICEKLLSALKRFGNFSNKFVKNLNIFTNLIKVSDWSEERQSSN